VRDGVDPEAPLGGSVGDELHHDPMGDEVLTVDPRSNASDDAILFRTW
jgi:hypothetical protein